MIPAIAAIISTLIANKMPQVASAVIDKGVDYVSDKLGIELKPDMTPEEILKVQEASLKHAEFMVTEANDNTEDARDMQKEALKQSDTFSKRFLPILTLVLITLCACFIGAATFLNVPEANQAMVNGFSEFIKVTFATIIGFWYGSSNGSIKKTEMLNDKQQ